MKTALLLIAALGGFTIVSAPAADIADTIYHGEVIKLGDVEITAHHTPGHTKGATTCTM